MKYHNHHFRRKATKAILVSAFAAGMVCQLAACAAPSEIPEIPTELTSVTENTYMDDTPKASLSGEPAATETTSEMPAETVSTTESERAPDALDATKDPESFSTETSAPAPVIRTEITEEYEEIPYRTVYEYSIIYYDGDRVTKQSGRAGELLRKTSTTYVDDAVTDVSVTETVVTEAVTEIIVIGTRSRTTQSDVTMTEDIVPYKTETRPDATRFDDESSVIQKGADGYTMAVYRITYEKGKEISRICVSREVTAPITEIVSVGTKPARTEETVTERENVVKYETKYIYDDTLADGTRRVKTAGKDGYTESVYKISYYHGEVSSRNLVKRTVHEPITEVIVIGTKKEEAFGLPFLANKGYILSQDYGNGHYAMDFAVWYGDPILAVKSGTVIYAYDEGDFPKSDSNWTYGTFVVIEHENGVRSLYAHLKSRTVSVGQKVTGGQVIGYSGNTGRVNPAPTASDPLAGTHLHFEIRVKKNGSYVKVDPKKYIPY